jgi:hypothetical protein
MNLKNNFDHDSSWEQLTKLFNSHLPINEAWTKLIEFHEKLAPKTYWDKLKSLDLAAEKEVLKDWLQDLATKSPIPETVSALWVGMFKHQQDGKEMYVIYLAGADNYSKDDIIWTSTPSYLPENRYAVPGILNEINELIEKDKTDYYFLDWILPVAYTAFILDEVIRTSLDKKLFLKHKAELHFTTGHDSGDYLDLTSIK